MVTSFWQLDELAAGGFGQVLALALVAADELALGVNHQRLDAEGSVLAGHLLDLFLEVHRLFSLQLGLTERSVAANCCPGKSVIVRDNQDLSQFSVSHGVGNNLNCLGEIMN